VTLAAVTLAPLASPTFTGTATIPTATITTLTNAVANANIGNGISNANRANQSQVVVSGTEYYFTNSGLTMPATFKGGIVAGSRLTWHVALNKTAAGTGSFAILFKHGTNGSTADTTDATITIGTQTAAVDTMAFDLSIVFTSTTAYYYSLIPVHTAASAAGFGLVQNAVAAQFNGTVTGLTTTTGSTIWGISFKATTGTPTITVPLCTANAYNIT
jgi:hypothetical protein